MAEIELDDIDKMHRSTGPILRDQATAMSAVNLQETDPTGSSDYIKFTQPLVLRSSLE